MGVSDVLGVAWEGLSAWIAGDPMRAAVFIIVSGGASGAVLVIRLLWKQNQADRKAHREEVQAIRTAHRQELQELQAQTLDALRQSTGAMTMLGERVQMLFTRH